MTRLSEVRYWVVIVLSWVLSGVCFYRYKTLLNELEASHAPIASFLAREVQGVPVWRHVNASALTVFRQGDSVLVCGYASPALLRD